jgi:hypothetical protein
MNASVNFTLPVHLAEFQNFLTIWYRAFIILFGIVGNSLTIVIFWRTKITHSKRTSYYLIRLAISDTCFLLTLSIRYFSEIDPSLWFYFDFYHTNRWVCKLSTYASYIFTFISCLFVLAFTAQRMCVICFHWRFDPNRIEKWSKIMVAGSLAFAIVFYSFLIYINDVTRTLEVDDRNMTVETSYCASKGAESTVEYFNAVDSVFTFIIPFFGMVIMNSMMIRTLRNSSVNFILRTSSNC